ncbi:MAG TPA: choice-of-anchor V domain-containing protein [Vicinamibacterales bacterium]|nr:choice-of-anchor V domain-containing protein [Vicinamibacterales bacterium]
MRPTALRLVVLAAVISAPPLALAYREGPLPAMTGGFGEETCAKCHYDHPLNARGGSLLIEGVPATYVPGREYRITIAVSHPEAKRAGFELSVRVADGLDKGQQAGMLRGPDALTQIVFVPGRTVQYLQHTKAGSDLNGRHERRWTIYWTAPPSSAGRVIFNVAANAANDDASALGDYVYTVWRMSRPAPR